MARGAWTLVNAAQQAGKTHTPTFASRGQPQEHGGVRERTCPKLVSETPVVLKLNPPSRPSYQTTVHQNFRGHHQTPSNLIFSADFFKGLVF